MELEERARKFAYKAHKGQFRKDNRTPFIEHPKAVVELLKRMGIKDEDLLSAAWLHDTVEDSGIKNEQIREEFNPVVERIVKALTRDVGRKKYKERIQNVDYAVQIIKLADTVHNCSELHSNLPQRTITRKLRDCKETYFDLAEKIYPEFFIMLREYLKKWKVYPS